MVTANVTGITQSINAIKQLERQLAKEASKVLRKAGSMVAKSQKSRAPVSKKGSLEKVGGVYVRGTPGRLKRAIKPFRSMYNTYAKNGVVGGYVKIYPGKKRQDFKGAWYGNFQDLGWKPGSQAAFGLEVVRQGLMTLQQYRAEIERRKAINLARAKPGKKPKKAVIGKRYGGRTKIHGKNFMLNGFNAVVSQVEALIQSEVAKLVTQQAQQIGLR